MDESTDLTDVVVALDLLANAATVLALVAVFVGVIQYFGDAARRRTEFRRAERARQEHVFEVVTTHYDAFLAMCMANPDLTLAQLSLRRPPDPGRPKPDPIRDLILFECFFQLLERAYVLYRADEIYEIGPDGQLDATRMDPSYAESVKNLSSAEYDLRHRQWWGWDEWIRDYLDSPFAESIERSWTALDNDDTNDRGFGAYMNHRIRESTQRRDAGG